MRLRCLNNIIPALPQNPPSSLTFASLFSTKTLAPPSSSSSSSSSLYDRIQVIRDPKVSVVPVLEQWVNEGRPVQIQNLRALMRLMKDFKRFNHALEISQWMTDQRYFTLSSIDVALRLELIHRVRGLEHAENYFNTISSNLKSVNAYSALLSGYVREKSVEKAESIMQKMKEMEMAVSSFPYNMMINLYTQTGEYDKIDMLMQEMERKGIPQDKYTMLNRMAAYIAESDISGMERILKRIEEDRHFSVSWKVCSMAASGYLKVGMIEKALAMLKKLEGNISLQGRESGFDLLLKFFTNAGNKEELYSVWNTYKPSTKPIDGSYACMISSLAELDDLEGAERIFEEWEAQCAVYDFRVLNSLLSAYCGKGLFNKAESVLKKKMEARTPHVSTCNVYLEHEVMPKAIKMLKPKPLVGRQRWRPNPIHLSACLNYLEEQGDVEGMEEFF